MKKAKPKTSMKDFRIKRGFPTATAFAKFLKVTPECVAQWERGERTPARKYRCLIRKKFPDIGDAEAWNLFFGPTT